MIPTAPSIDPEEHSTSACPNCGADCVGLYCSVCGQKDQPLRQSVLHFVRDGLVEVFGIDGRLWRTLRLLLFKPGSLTTAFIDGKRQQYIRPFRLYLTASVLFFTLISVLDPVAKLRQEIDQRTSSDTTATVTERLDTIAIRLIDDDQRYRGSQQALIESRSELDNLRLRSPLDSTRIKRTQLRVERDEQGLEQLVALNSVRKKRFDWQRKILEGYPPDSTIRPTDIATASNHVFPGFNTDGGGGSVTIGLPEWAIRNNELRRMRDATTSTEREAAIIEFGRGAIRRIPPALFVLLPVFALLLKMLYARSRARSLVRPLEIIAAKATGKQAPKKEIGWFYTEHLVFGLHTHAFLFFVLALVAVSVGSFGWVTSNAIIVSLLLMWTVVYFALAMKRVYGQGWVKTLLKAWILGWVYPFILLIFGFALAIILAAILG